MERSQTYSTRSAAIRAAKAHCRRILGEQFEPALHVDFDVIADTPMFHYKSSPYSGPSYYKLLSVCAEA